MINWILALFTVASAQYTTVSETSLCSFQKSETNIRIICHDNEATYALSIDGYNHGNFYFGQWNNSPTGFGLSGKIIDNPSDSMCGFYEFRKSYNGIDAEIQSEYHKNIKKVYHSVVNEGNVNGFIVQNDLDYFQIGNIADNKLNGFGLRYSNMFAHFEIGFFQNDELLGEGIVYDMVNQEILHGTWLIDRIEKENTDEKYVPITKVIPISKTNLKEWKRPLLICEKQS